ncbi:MAG: 5-formyltetrahydrofolate cyclo-ligase [Actinomycetia bacterium]|nr:5-formyltetrahydrofolate cyclo-ligase [Actinomycetes bacterium]
MINKSKIRQQIQEKRDKLDKEKRLSKSRIIADKFLASSFYINSKVIMAYWPFRSEIDTTLIISRAITDRKMVTLPRVCHHKLALYYVQNPALELGCGAYGIMEPIEEKCRAANPRDIDMVIVPGVAFDLELNRLGYGGGYYDKLLATLGKRVKKIALCFDIQIISRVPAEEHDVKVDGLITESREIFCPR